MPDKVDLYRQDKRYYSAKREPEQITVPPMAYLTISGKGAPEGDRFQSMLNAIYNAAYTVKFDSKAVGRDFKVTGLEGLWWGEERKGFLDVPREKWRFKLMIRVPDFITAATLKHAKSKIASKKDVPYLDEVKFEIIDEGLCVQVLHIGPYAEEEATVEKLHLFAGENGLAPVGHHHEIYLSDPRRVAPERLRTILRQPVRRKR